MNIFDMKLILLNEKVQMKRLKKSSGFITFLCNLTELFQESKSVKFLVGGFDTDDWGADCAFDLLTVLTQLPDILKCIEKENYNFNLDFYEQGMERILKFTKVDENSVSISCEDMMTKKPYGTEITTEKEAVKRIFIDFNNSFIDISKRLVKNIDDNLVFKRTF